MFVTTTGNNNGRAPLDLPGSLRVDTRNLRWIGESEAVPSESDFRGECELG